MAKAPLHPDNTEQLRAILPKGEAWAEAGPSGSGESSWEYWVAD